MLETEYLTVKLFTEKHPSFSSGSLRTLIIGERRNGLAKACAIIRIGRKILIDEQKFFDWVKTQNKV